MEYLILGLLILSPMTGYELQQFIRKNLALICSHSAGSVQTALAKLEKDGNGFSYHALACYFDHISFILEGDIDCILTPEEEGIKLQIIDEGAEDPIIEKHIHKREDLINAVSGFLSAYRGQEAEER